MENVVFCFSGTGNSLALARDIARELGDTEIVMIGDVMDQAAIDLPYTRVGLIFPVYFAGGLPPIVDRLIDKLDFSQSQYIFSVVTAGAMHGGALDNLAGRIAEQGGRLHAGYAVQMPGNYIAMYGAWPAWLQRFMLKRAKKKAVHIAAHVGEKHVNRTGDGQAKGSAPLTERINGYERFALDYHVTDQCTACGQCVRICPTHNIAMVDGKPQYGSHCERCMACIQWCPAEAIQYKGKTEKRKRYRNPDIKASDLF